MAVIGSSQAAQMITGYNTDVRHQDVVFHVQTEDKGSANPNIESLIYIGGQVVAAKRASYADLLAAGEGETAVVARMERQHRLMIAAIRSGRFDEKLSELAAMQSPKEEAAAGPGAGREVARGAAAVSAGAVPSTSARRSTAAPRPPGAARGRVAAGLASPTLGSETVSSGGAEPLPDLPVAAEAAAIADSLDQVILGYLAAEADQERLELAMEPTGKMALGEDVGLAIHAHGSKSGAPVQGAKVTVRMISTVAEPVTLAWGSTDIGGDLRLAVRIPDLERGTAALLVLATSPLGNAEIKQLL